MQEASRAERKGREGGGLCCLLGCLWSHQGPALRHVYDDNVVDVKLLPVKKEIAATRWQIHTGTQAQIQTHTGTDQDKHRDGRVCVCVCVCVAADNSRQTKNRQWTADSIQQAASGMLQG